MQSLGRIDIDLLIAEYGNLQTDEVIITDERREHIKTYHPDDLGYFEKYGSEAISSPDYIIKDVKNVGTVFMVKRLPDDNLNIIVRLALDTDKNGLKNSVMTSYRLREKNLQKLIRKNELLYKGGK